MKILLGVVENLVVQSGNFIIFVDFVVLEIDNGDEIPLILDTSFLVMTQANANIANVTMNLIVEGKEMEFEIHEIA